MVDGSSSVGCCLTESQSRGCRNYWRRRTTWRSLEWLVVVVGCSAGEEMIAASRLRGNRPMRTNVWIATAQSNVHKQLCIAIEVVDCNHDSANIYLRRPLSASLGRTPNHHPSRKTCPPRIEHGRPRPADSRSTLSCFGPREIVCVSSEMLKDEELSLTGLHDDYATTRTSVMVLKMADDAVSRNNRLPWLWRCGMVVGWRRMMK